jgi:hypothetical protein
MWIEELFGDWQDRSFHLSRSRIYRPARLSAAGAGTKPSLPLAGRVASYIVTRPAATNRPDRPSRLELFHARSKVDPAMFGERRSRPICALFPASESVR